MYGSSSSVNEEESAPLLLAPLPPRNFNDQLTSPSTRQRMQHEHMRRQNAQRRLRCVNRNESSGTVFQKIFSRGSVGVAAHQKSMPIPPTAGHNKSARRMSKTTGQQQFPTVPPKGNNSMEQQQLELQELQQQQPISLQTTGKSRRDRRHRHNNHSFWFSMLNPHSKQRQAVAYKHFITSVIVTDLIFFIVSTDPRVQQYDSVFDAAEGVVSCIFLLEYVARLVTITESLKYGERGPVKGRLSYAFGTSAAWIDLLATAPFFVERGTGLELPKLTVLRMFRLFRILKTESYIRAMDAVYRVIYFNSEILSVAVLVCVFLTLATAVLLYLLRPPPSENGDNNNADFASIAATLYVSTLLLTGQGGPQDSSDYPLPWYTKAVVILTSIFSVAMFAIPASMLTWGFEAEAARMAKRARKRALQKQSPTTTSCSSSNSSSSSDGDTTDDEYFRVIAGEEDDGDENEHETPWMKRVREAFEKADRDADGTLTLDEATNLIATANQQGSPGDDLAGSVNSMEAELKETNKKLDLILQLLKGT